MGDFTHLIVDAGDYLGSNLAGTRITKMMSQWGVSLVNANGSLTAPGAIDQLRLENRQIALKLPRSDLDAVVLPLLALDLDVPVEDVLAQRPQDEL